MSVPVDQRREYVIWSSPGVPLTVRLAGSAIERINLEVMKGFGVTRRRGTEAGGILLGRVEPGASTTIWIEDVEPVPCEYAFGPSFVLSDNDEFEFKQAVDRWRAKPGPTMRPVGFFRGHTRDGLAIDDADVEVFSRYFSVGMSVVLLVKPFATRTSRASFFVPKDGRLNPASAADEFPFSLEPAGSEVESDYLPLTQTPPKLPKPVEVRQRPAVVPQPVVVPPVVETPASPEPREPARAEVRAEPVPRKPTEADKVLAGILGPRINIAHDEDEYYDAALFGSYGTPRRRSPWRRRIAWVAFTIAALGLGGAVGFQYAGGRNPAIILNTAGAAAPAPDPYSPKLSVQQQGTDLLLRWDGNSPVAQAAQRGLLVVSDSKGSKEVKLGYPEVRSGVVIYQEVAPEITFRLELVIRDNTTLVDTIVWRAPAVADEGNGPAQATR